MSRTAWKLAELASKPLESDEREAVLGDLLESNQSALRALLDISGLVFRRQAGLWKGPRPWLAGFLTLPCSWLLMHVSLSVTCTYQRLVHHKLYTCWHTGHEGFPLLLCHIFLLIAWSWSGGYIVESVSRRTLWASAALSVFPALNLCWSDSELPSRLCLFLFILPAIFGVRRGLRKTRISLLSASFLAFIMTVLMISAWSYQALWMLNWALILPAWCLVAMAWHSVGRTMRPAGHASAI